jgi:hypothetical protein
MSLDGLRAWIGEVERKLGMRTRVFLVLLAIAIGASGAAIYLALEADGGGGTSTGGATAEEVQELRDRFELEGSDASQVAAMEAQIVQLRTELEALRAEGGDQQPEGESGGGTGGGTGSGSGAESGAKELPETGVGQIPESEAK